MAIRIAQPEKAIPGIRAVQTEKTEIMVLIIQPQIAEVLIKAIMKEKSPAEVLRKKYLQTALHQNRERRITAVPQET